MKLFIYILSGVLTFLNVHQFSFNHADGTHLPLNEFSGKKILLVNISTVSPLNYQLRGLQELHRLYKDSLVIIGVPSLSLSTEQHTAKEIDSICRGQFGVGYLITQPVHVADTAAHPLYKWLADGQANGAGTIQVKKDFQKILFDKDGEIMGVYAPGVDPLDSTIHKAILGLN